MDTTYTQHHPKIVTMTGNSLTEDDAHYQSYDEFSFSQPFGTSDGAAGSATGGVDTGQISRGTHPTAVDEPFQQQHHDSSNPLSSACDPGFPWPAVPSYGWPNDEMSPNLFASFSDFPAYSPTGPSAAPPSATGLTGLTGLTGATQTATSFIDMREQPGIVPVTSPAACKKVDEETLLKSLRDAGYGYTAISEAMRKQLGIEITANALVKRYQKMPNACESVSGLPSNPDIWNLWMARH